MERFWLGMEGGKPIPYFLPHLALGVAQKILKIYKDEKGLRHSEGRKSVFLGETYFFFAFFFVAFFFIGMVVVPPIGTFSVDLEKLHELLRLLRGPTYYHKILCSLDFDVKNFPQVGRLYNRGLPCVIR